ncbi:DUF4870 family protein [Tepidicaulis sp. LMO-SS28]|uniref:DUF4870 family protein n=1 Tax=Tepidicaulis sp. LMO-SS28 TaxID=3447455 RepID=UPI003EE30D5C
MSETQGTPAPAATTPDADGVKLVYILYFLGFVIGISSIAGVIVAYLKRGEASAVSATHYTYQIRTFWIGLLYGVVGTLTTVILIGWLILLFTVIWALIRCIKGFIAIGENKSIEDPATWLW